MTFWCAYLLLAIRDMDSGFHGLSARDFVFSGEPRPLGFVWTCEQIGIDANALRQACMTRRGRARVGRSNHYTHRKVRRAA